jgi:NAD(P)-dependent dehydrogenase (short-subunit alcohol dehydrogenase family)
MSIILITGCSTGIGYAIAQSLAVSGHTVYATMRNPQRSPQLQQWAAAEKINNLTVLSMDVNDDKSIQDAVDFIMTKEKQIDVLVNNAGVGSWGALEELSMEFFRNDMETNYFGTVRCIKAVTPSMRKRRSGTIINVTSVAGKLYSNFHAPYCASKAATEAMSEALSQELIPFNVRVALVEPGIIETPIFNKVNEVPAVSSYPNFKRFLSIFSASLENHVQPSVVGDVVNDIVSGKRSEFRNPAGPDAEGLLGWRSSSTDADWINSANVTDEKWIAAMEQMGLPVRKYTEAETMPDVSIPQQAIMEAV